MARKPRIHYAGAVYHVILSGLDQQAVFKSVADRRYWESLVADGVERFGHELHAYCWSRDHVQIAVRVNEVPLSKAMQNLTFRYTRYFNAKHGRKGPLFHGRYKAIVVDADQYLSELVRYIHNNPVRNSNVKSASAAKWTSHAGYIDAANQPSWLTTSAVLAGFGTGEKAARRAFAKFVDAGKNEGERLDLMRGTQGGRILGDKKFAKKALRPAKPLVSPVTPNQLVKRVCKVEGVKESDLKTASRVRSISQVRQTITYLATELNVASLTDMAKRFNRDLTTMSRNQRYYRERLAENKEMQQHVKKVKFQVLSG